MRRFLFILFLLAGALGAASQEVRDSPFSSEMEDSVSALAIKPLKPSQMRRLLKQVIKRFKRDSEQEHEVGKYRIDATFNRDTLAPLSVSCTVFAEAGIALPYLKEDLQAREFKYEGPYKLTRMDSIYIGHYLNTFPLLSPNHVPSVIHLLYGFHGHIDKGTLLPFENYGETLLYYKVAAYSITNAAGKSVYRFVFTRNGMERFGKDQVYGKKYDVGELTGTAYFDSKTLRITQFKGYVRLPAESHVLHIRYQNDYDEEDDSPVLRRTLIRWEGNGTEIKASVRRTNN